MSDLISRSALLKKFQYRVPSNDRTANILNALADTITQIIKDAPAVDAVPVVRCKDCKHWRKGDFQVGDDLGRMEWGGGCPIVRFCRTESNFCSYGERKDNATD